MALIFWEISSSFAARAEINVISFYDFELNNNLDFFWKSNLSVWELNFTTNLGLNMLLVIIIKLIFKFFVTFQYHIF